MIYFDHDTKQKLVMRFASPRVLDGMIAKMLGLSPDTR